MDANQEDKPTPFKVVEGDKNKATAYKTQLSEALIKVCDIMGAAKRDDILLSFQLLNNNMGQFFISDLKAVKEL